jgi:arabinofuranosyltransferase
MNGASLSPIIAPKKIKIVLITFLTILLLCIESFYFSFVLDDPFITYRFAKNLAAGYGLRWNPSTAPVEGYTSFAWVLLSFVGIRIGLNPVIWTKIIGGLFGLGVLILLIHMVTCWRKPNFVAILFIGLLLVTHFDFSFYAVSGLETSLFLFLFLLAIWRLAQEEKRRQFPWSSIFFAFASYVRPETWGIFALSALFVIVYHCIREHVIPTPVLYWLAIYILLFAPYYYWRFSYYGYFFPNTYYAKHTGGGWHQLRLGMNYLGGYFETYGLFILPLALIGNVRFLVFKPMASERFESYYSLFLTIFLMIYIVTSGGDPISAFPGYRLTLPVTLILLLWTAKGISLVNLYLRGHSNNTNLIFYLIAFILALGYLNQALKNFTKFQTFMSSFNETQGLKSAGIKPPRETPAIRWLNDNFPPDTTMAVLAAGRLGYFTEFKIIDRLGLLDEHIAHLPKENDNPNTRLVDTKFDTDYILGLEPDIIQTNLRVSEVLEDSVKVFRYRLADRTLWENVYFQSNYQLISDIPSDKAFFIRKDFANYVNPKSAKDSQQ